jgi:hypothetical protein
MVHWPEVAMLGQYFSLADEWLKLFMVGPWQQHRIHPDQSRWLLSAVLQ